MLNSVNQITMIPYISFIQIFHLCNAIHLILFKKLLIAIIIPIPQTQIFNQQLIQINLLQQIERTKNQIKKKQIQNNNKIRQSDKRSRWTQKQDEELIQQINQIGIENYKQIKVQNKTGSQVYFRLRNVYYLNIEKFKQLQKFQ
ncbi:SANT/Myb_domain [Hexamita inflata]|uniref:SANT/Myb domain n=1 Tax=Hexamita inflata TaxID=28002 RepID=A0AA86QW18_9EUKA|nr:SANT/Myb domain [Hexamita inflata]